MKAKIPLQSQPALDPQAASVLRRIVKELNLSARAYARILIVARGLAEKARLARIDTRVLLDAVQFCTLAGVR